MSRIQVFPRALEDVHAHLQGTFYFTVWRLLLTHDVQPQIPLAFNQSRSLRFLFCAFFFFFSLPFPCT
jgi:hypothetical protein